MERILIAYDGSEASTSAVEIGCSLANISAAEVVGLYVKDERRLMQIPITGSIAAATGLTPLTPEPLAAPDMLSEIEKTEQEALGLQAEFERQCAEAGVEGEFVSEFGNAPDSIAKLAKKVDFIVIGSAGLHSGLANIKPGSTAEALLHATTSPVLVVPEQTEGQASMVIAYDGSRPSERALHAAMELAGLSEIEEIHLLTVSKDEEKGEKIQEPAREYLESGGWNITVHLCSGQPEEEIRNCVKEAEASYLVLGAFGSNALKEALLGSTTKAVLQDPPCAVLFVS